MKYRVDSHVKSEMSWVLGEGDKTFCVTEGPGHASRAKLIAELLNVGTRAVKVTLALAPNQEPNEVVIEVAIDPDPNSLPTVRHTSRVPVDGRIDLFGCNVDGRQVEATVVETD